MLINKIKDIFAKTSSKLSKGIDTIFANKRVTQEELDSLEEILILSDIGPLVAERLKTEVSNMKFKEEVSSDEVKKILAKNITQYLYLTEKNEEEAENITQTTIHLTEGKLNVILISGVNGSGKTTSIGKLTNYYQKQNKKIAIAACDTFRAAAVEQIELIASKCGAILFKGLQGQDPASVAYNAVIKSIEQNLDILFIDTAGRLHNYGNLMDELSKIYKVITKIDKLLPQYSLLVIDASTGQNIYNQVEHFASFAKINGLIVTKFDGTAKAGALVGVVDRFKIPIYFTCYGENIEDIEEFNAIKFVQNILYI